MDHLEACTSCQEKLATIGGDSSWWDDARDCLSDPDVLQHADQLPQAPPIDLSFLDDATHPEMLGRIGRYDVEALVGCGGMGVVLRAHDGDLHRTVAIKVMAPQWAASIPARERFAREAQAAASVAHENVVPIYNVEADAKQPFLVMQYVPGMTLQSWITANGALEPATILRVAGQMAEGLSAAHRRGLVHRDVKPGNVLVGENVDRVWLTDFGLAHAADSATLTHTGVIAGTPHYMSPEQARGESIDHRSDLFSLGCVLYFLSTGKPPFAADNTLAVLHKLVTEKPVLLSAQRNDLPPSFVSLVDQLLRRSPAKRPADCDAVLQQLSVAQEELQTGKVAKPPMSRAKRLILFSPVAAAACYLIVAGAISVLRRDNESQATNAVPSVNSSSIVMMILLSCPVMGQDDAEQTPRKSSGNNAETDLFGDDGRNAASSDADEVQRPPALRSRTGRGGEMTGGDLFKSYTVPDPFNVKTDDVPGFGADMDMYGGEAMEEMGMGMGMQPRPSPDALFRVGLQRAITALKKAKTSEEKSVLKKHVQNAFDARCERMMVKRKKQLDKLKKQIGSLEKDLDRRAAAKARVVQLQVQSVELAAEGLLELNELQGMPAAGGGGLGGMNGMSDMGADYEGGRI